MKPLEYFKKTVVEKDFAEMMVLTNEYVFATMIQSAIGFNLVKEKWPNLERRLELLKQVILDYEDEMKKQSNQ